MQVIPGEFTASFFATTDKVSAQIATFYPGAMAKSAVQTLKDVRPKPDLVVVISECAGCDDEVSGGMPRPRDPIFV